LHTVVVKGGALINKALCLRFLEQVNQTGEPLMITKKGEPLAVVYPAPKQRTRVPFCIAQGTAKIKANIVEPAGDSSDWEMLQV
jgi:antitoxin (DNA-binding transcriptional repressor) of toxin-antitoxin stability system